MANELESRPVGPQEDRNPVDLLADEFAERLRLGETPSVAEYAEKYPDLAEEIQEVFPSIVMLEQLNSQHEAEAQWTERRASDALPSKTHLGDFEIVQVIGRGGMGIVYEAVQQSLHRPVALKVLNSGAVHSANQVIRFEREASAAARLHHTNIVPVFGVGEQDGLHYYVMQLINGQGLDIVLAEVTRMIRRKEPLSLPTGGSTDSISARELAGVLMSREIAGSTHRGGSPVAWGPDSARPSSDIASPILDPAQSPTVLENVPTPGPAQATTPPRPAAPFVESRDSHGLVRSEHILRESLEDVSASASGHWPLPPDREVVRSDFVLWDEAHTGELEAGTTPMTSKKPPKSAAPADRLDLSALGPRYWRNVAKLGLQVAAGLQYAHTQGTLHRDIKPANILLDADGIAWIADFGLAKLLEQENVTRTGDVVGTLRYMAPEQFRGQTDARSDLYSLGLTLYELLTLRPAFDETDRQSLIARKLTPEDLPPIRKSAPGISRDLETIVLKCVHFEPDARYRSAAALVSDLQNYLADRPIQARPISPWERFRRWCRRNPMVAALSMATAALLMLTTAITSVGYIKEKDRALTELGLRTKADNERQRAFYEQGKAEQTADIALSALDVVYRSFVPDRLTGVVELDASSAEDPMVRMTAISPETAALLEQLLPVFDELAALRGDDPRYLAASAIANRRLGELNHQFDRTDEAREAYERAIETYERLLTDTSDPSGVLLQIARVRNDLGEVLRRTDREQSNASHQAALDILDSDAVRSGRPEVRFELARTHYLLGQRPRWFGGSFTPGQRRPDRRRGERGDSGPRGPEFGRGPERTGERPGTLPWPDPAIAANHLEQGILLLEELVSEYPLVSDYDYLLSICLLERSRSPDIDEEEQSDDLIGAVVILEGLVSRFPDEPEYLYQLSEAYERRYFDWVRSREPAPWHRVAIDENRASVSVSEVEAALRSAIKLSNRVVALQPHVSAYAISNAMLHSRLAELLTAQNKLEEAEQHLRTAVRVHQDVARLAPEATPVAQGGKVWAQLGLTRLLVQQDKNAEARELLGGILAEIEAYRAENPDDAWFTNRPLAEMYRALAHVLEKTGDDTGAEEARTHAERLDPPDRHSPGRPRI